MDSNVIFYDENDNIIDNKNLEAEEQILVNKYIKSFYKVLELGARYGTVSHIINKKLVVKTNQVSVEPDSRVWNALEKNRQNYNSQYHIVKGFVSNKNQPQIVSAGYQYQCISIGQSPIGSIFHPVFRTHPQFPVMFSECPHGDVF